MKDIIIIIGMIALGIGIFNMMLADENSLKSSIGNSMEKIHDKYENF